MKRFALAGLFVVGLVGASWSADPPAPPPAEKEHKWLAQKFVGEWTCEGQCFMEPGKPIKMTGTDSVKALGEYWITSTVNGKMEGMPMEMVGHMTVGYDIGKKKFVGSWVCNCCPHLWTYEGSVDSTGKILTLNAEGPNMKDPTKTAKYRDVTEFKSDTHRVLTSEMEVDGKWVTIMTLECKKK